MIPYFVALFGGVTGSCTVIGSGYGIYYYCFRKSKVRKCVSETTKCESALEKCDSELSLRSGGKFYPSHVEWEHLKKTNQFSDDSITGECRFGVQYKCQLHDGKLATLQRRPGPRQDEFGLEAAHLVTISHANIVNLIDYSEEDEFQTLIFERFTNVTLADYLYGKNSKVQLYFRRRISIALDAARALKYLHCMSIVHGYFNASVVLVDDDFNVKVADAGIMIFIDPRLSGLMTKTNDVRDFGLLLLEIVSGKDCKLLGFGEELVTEVKDRLTNQTLVDTRLGVTFTPEGMRRFIDLMLRCLTVGGGQNMEMTVLELERILEHERKCGTTMDPPAVLLGSEIFAKC